MFDRLARVTLQVFMKESTLNIPEAVFLVMCDPSMNKL